MTTKRQIFAMGGGGFSMEPFNPLLDRYLLSLCEKENPKVCFIGTASSDDAGYRDKFYNSFKDLPCEASHIALTEIHPDELYDFVAKQDIFYVGGGNTVNLLKKWRASKLDQYLRFAYERGAIMAGLSAGSICWFEEGLSDSVEAGKLEPLECLGWIGGSHCPHFDSEPERQEKYKSLIIYQKMKAGWALDDGCAIHYVDEEVFRIVGSHPDKAAYKYSSSMEHPNQQGIEAGYLGGGSVVVRPASTSELESLVEKNKEFLKTMADSGSVTGKNPCVGFVLEVYGTIKAHAVLQFPDVPEEAIREKGQGKTLHYWCDDAISGKLTEDNFKSALSQITQKDFC